MIMKMNAPRGGDPIERCVRRGPPLQKTQPELELESVRGGGHMEENGERTTTHR